MTRLRLDENAFQSPSGAARAPAPHAVWPAAIVILSLGLFLAAQGGALTGPASGALAYLPPAIASLLAAIYCWMRFRHEASGWWLGCTASFLLFLTLTGQQILLEAFALPLLPPATADGGRPLPWQPWVAGRLVLALGILSAYSASRGLQARAGAAARHSAITVGALSLFFCPVWTDLLPVQPYFPAANGLSAIDSVLLVLSGLALVFAYGRTRLEMRRGDPFHGLLCDWFLALAWSAACRAFPFGDVRTAIWVELTAVGISSMAVSARLVWHLSGSGGRLASRMACVTAARDVLAECAGVDDGRLAGTFVEAVGRAVHAARAMLLTVVPGEQAVVVSAAAPPPRTGIQTGSRLSLEPGRRNGFAGGPAVRCLKEGRTLVVPDASSDVEFVHWTEFTDEGAYQVCIPVAGREGCAGVLLLWFPGNAWRPWECVPMAEEIVRSCAPLLARLPALNGTIHLETPAAGAA